MSSSSGKAPAGSSAAIRLVLTAVVAGGIVLRATSLQFGLPAVYNPDEVAIMNRALAFSTGGLNPHNFLYPTLYFYALYAWEGAFFVAGYLTGTFPSVAAFERSFFVDPTAIFTAGRALGAGCGVLTILATYALGRRLFGRWAGVAAAAFLAVAPLAVRDAHYVKHDVPVTLAIVLTHGALAAVVFDGSRRERLSAWLLTGALSGLAISTHYYAVFVMVPIAVAGLACDWRTVPLGRRLARLGAAGAAAIVAFAITTPFLFVEPGTAWRDIVANREIVVNRATDAGGAFASLGFYIDWLATDAVGRMTAGIAVVGLVATAVRGWRQALLLGAFPVTFLLAIANTFPASRYLNPLLPFLALLAASAVTWIASRGRVPAVVATALALGAVADAGRASVAANRFFGRDDTRTQASAWIARSIPPGASVLIQPYSVPLRMSHDALVEALETHLGSPARASVKFQRQLALTPYPAPAYRTIYLGSGGLDVDKIYVDPKVFEPGPSLAPLRALAVEYVILKRYNVLDPSLTSLDAALVREAGLVVTFSPYRAGVTAAQRAAVAPFLHNADARIDSALERPGPTIEIWRIH